MPDVHLSDSDWPLEGKQTTHAGATGFCSVLSLSWAAAGFHSPVELLSPREGLLMVSVPPAPNPHCRGCCPGCASFTELGRLMPEPHLSQGEPRCSGP